GTAGDTASTAVAHGTAGGAGTTAGTADARPSARFGPAGEIVPEWEFLGLAAAVDEFELLTLSPEAAERAVSALADHPLAKVLGIDRIDKAIGDAAAVARQPGALALHTRDGELAGAMRTAQSDDESLAAHILLENLASKVTASLALLHLLDRAGVDPASIPFVIGCGEEAIGDRYQRGGGNLA